MRQFYRMKEKVGAGDGKPLLLEGAVFHRRRNCRYFEIFHQVLVKWRDVVKIRYRRI